MDMNFSRSLYLAADKYEIPHLRDLCRNQLRSSLNSSNALNIIELAQIPFDKALNDAAFTTIKDNISTIASSAEFKLFVVNNLILSVEIMKASLVHPHINNKLRAISFSERLQLVVSSVSASVIEGAGPEGWIIPSSRTRNHVLASLGSDKYLLAHKTFHKRIST
ncbi:hypothetical protein Bca52824_003543 [Brassica carinata]|uniref:Uncharacterized protein n=1 Tax=Brassica carinata TaxID=52824 RepID=A0A8X8BFC2_BRACI|nr:hypothetical protein Bca52824_003543 [Brassica carinata]